MILICYDGSTDSKAAIERAAELFADQSTVVLTVWDPFTDVIARTTVGFALLPSPIANADEIDGASRKAAEKTAEDGAALARKHGITAEPSVRPRTSTIARAILVEADKVGASAIVMGSRGLGGMASLLLGSVSHEVIQHADRTVSIVPSPEVAAKRAREVHEEAAGS